MAWRPRGRSRLIGAVRSGRAVLLLALLALTAACRATPADDIVATWLVDPSAPRTATETRLNLVLRDRAGQPVRGAKLQIAAHMSHPGMAPIVADAVETVPGSYAVVMQFTMSGDWTMVASGVLADGRRITRSTDVEDVR